jgi:23S rRNA-intervening sequence protein
MGALQGFKELRVYPLAFKFVMEIFHLSKSFPPEEKYSLSDQIRRASRSVAANIAEGYRKKSIRRCLSANWLTLMVQPLKLKFG